jgi:uncharacterized GH25 family protein
MRFLTAIVLAVGLAATAPAHFVFVYVDGAEAKLVFGHKAEPDAKASAARCEKTTLTARDTTGKETKLTVDKGNGNFYRAKLPAGKPMVVFGTTEAGVTQFADNPPLLSWYYPKVIVGDPFVKGTEVGAGVPLDVIPVRDGSKVRFKVLASGKPAADIEVTIGLPGNDEDKAPVVKTDKDGLTEAFAERGRYCVAARRSEDKPGELRGKKYSAVRYTATLVIDFAGSE